MQVLVGRIGRAHGLRGEVGVEIRTDAPHERFAPGTMLATEPSGLGPLTVRSARPHGGQLLVRFDGVVDRSTAENLRGLRLMVEVAPDAAPDDPEEFYDHQLIDLAAETTVGDHVGAVAEVLHLPGQDVLALRRPHGGEVLVPFVAEFVPVVDLVAGRIVLDPPPGLLED